MNIVVNHILKHNDIKIIDDNVKKASESPLISKIS